MQTLEALEGDDVAASTMICVGGLERDAGVPGRAGGWTAHNAATDLSRPRRSKFSDLNLSSRVWSRRYSHSSWRYDGESRCTSVEKATFRRSGEPSSCPTPCTSRPIAEFGRLFSGANAPKSPKDLRRSARNVAQQSAKQDSNRTMRVMRQTWGHNARFPPRR